MIFVAVFELDRVYGGPEEGGWWFNTGDLMKVVKAWPERDEEKAYDYSRRFNRTLAFRREEQRKLPYGDGRLPIQSVNYSGGHYQAEVWTDIPHSYPERTPHYE